MCRGTYEDFAQQLENVPKISMREPFVSLSSDEREYLKMCFGYEHSFEKRETRYCAINRMRRERNLLEMGKRMEENK
jgi:hypothetical protein